MTVYNIVTTLVTLGALALSLTIMHYARQKTSAAAQAMLDLLYELQLQTKQGEERLDAEAQAYQTMIGRVERLEIVSHHHAGRLNDVEDMVDLLNHDDTAPISSDIEMTSEFLNEVEQVRVSEGIDLEDTQRLSRVVVPALSEFLPTVGAWQRVVDAAQRIPEYRAAYGTTDTDDGRYYIEQADQARAEFQVHVFDPALTPSLYAASVRELARHQLRGGLDHEFY